MTSTPNPILPPIALLQAQAPSVYLRQEIYDPTWNDPLYASFTGSQRIVPAVGSIVQDADKTPLWVVSVDPVTFVPTYDAVPLSTENDNVVSVLNYGNTLFRLYTDYRAKPYPVKPDAKCVFIGKSPRNYTLSRYPGTANESVISQYYDQTGKFASQQIPMVPLDTTNTSWYLQRCHIADQLDDNEEILAKIYGEDGAEVFSVLFFAKESAVINEDIIFTPSIVNMTISGNQQLANGTFFLYENQNFDSLGLTATLVYDDGTTATIPTDDNKCILYGQSDFIASFAGLVQTMTVKYYRSANESISPSLADATGEMISIDIPVTVIPNELGITVKVVPIPTYNSALARYVMRYWMYFGDGRSHLDVSGYITYTNGPPVTDSSYFGVTQSYQIVVDMSQVDPTHYPTEAVYQQTIAITFGPPNTLVKWTFKDALTAPIIYGQDTPTSRRPSICFDATKKQYFIPSGIFTNTQAFLNSFYYNAAPPFDPSTSLIPQVPTHFVIRDIISGAMKVAAPIPVGSYAQAFTILGDQTGIYVGTDLMVEFVNVINSNSTNILYGTPSDVTAGTYISS